jgi:hypothetical protein
LQFFDVYKEYNRYTIHTQLYQLAKSANGSRALPWLFDVFELWAALFCGATAEVIGSEIPAPNPGLLEGVEEPETELPDAEANVPNMLLV